MSHFFVILGIVTVSEPSTLERQLSEITKCPICFEELKNPRSLPCLHSFCFRCLKRQCRDKEPGAKEPCPICRREFTVPQRGPAGLNFNFYLQNLIDIKHGSSDVPCDRCSAIDESNLATVVCVDCDLNLCERCSLPHKQSEEGPHDVIPLSAITRTEPEQESTSKGNVERGQIKGYHLSLLLVTSECVYHRQRSRAALL